MKEAVWLPIKVSDIMQRFQEKIFEAVQKGNNARVVTDDYLLFVGELRQLVEKWNKRV